MGRPLGPGTGLEDHSADAWLAIELGLRFAVEI
jgi:hypothetical protein